MIKETEQIMRTARLCSLPVVLLLLSACDPFGEQLDVVDAARLYEENLEVFERIRARYPGPFDGWRRIPAFEESENRPEDIAFLEEIQRSLPVEILSLHPWGPGGSDVIEVVVGTYGIAVSGSVVSIKYYESFDRDSIVQRGVEVFDQCDERSINWLDMANKIGYADVYCRLTDNWYAYQSVT